MSKVSDEANPLLPQEEDCTHDPYPYDYGISNRNDGETAAASHEPERRSEPNKSSRKQAPIIAILLLGVFVANADGTFVMAQTGAISSEFDGLGGSEWLMTVFFLASCAVQPVVGKLSDIYGRKQLLLWSYGLFTLGNLATGLSDTMWQVLVGRGLAGAGGAGMLSLVSILIVDLVHIREVAAWRSYVNVMATTGRSIGGPLGGALADFVGWRWSFYGQCPITLTALALVWWKLPKGQDSKRPSLEPGDNKGKERLKRLGRIDFLGAATAIIATISFLLALEIGSKNMMWTSPITIALLAAFVLASGSFIYIEKNWAKEPIFPVHLMLHRDILTTYPVAVLQAIAQMGLMYGIPLYFQIVQGASTLNAGARLVPAFVGNTLGGLLCGFVIHRTGRYKYLTLFGLGFASLGYVLITLRWGRQVGWLESLYILPGGFGMAVVMSTTFIAVTAGVKSSDLAVAGAGLYQANGIGAALGSCFAMSVLQASLKPMLTHALREFSGKDEIISRSMQDITYVRSLKGPLRDIVLQSYVKSLRYTHDATYYTPGGSRDV